MKLSTRARYGMHAMFDLAKHADGQPVPLKAIAERECIPEPYLEQLMATLRKEGLVRSVRGAQGGYILEGEPREVAVGRILRALEGDLAPVSCLLDEHACGRTCDCASRPVWQAIQHAIEQAVDSLTLQDMLDEDKQIKESK